MQDPKYFENTLNRYDLVNSDPELSELKYHLRIKNVQLSDSNFYQFASNIHKGFVGTIIQPNTISTVQIATNSKPNFPHILCGFKRDAQALKAYELSRTFIYNNRESEIQLVDVFKLLLDTKKIVPKKSQNFLREAKQYKRKHSSSYSPRRHSPEIRVLRDSRSRSRSKERKRQRQRQLQRQTERKRQKEKEKQTERQKEKEKERLRELQREREQELQKVLERQRQRQRQKQEQRERERQRQREKERQKQRERQREKQRNEQKERIRIEMRAKQGWAGRLWAVFVPADWQSTHLESRLSDSLRCARKDLSADKKENGQQIPHFILYLRSQTLLNNLMSGTRATEGVMLLLRQEELQQNGLKQGIRQHQLRAIRSSTTQCENPFNDLCKQLVSFRQSNLRVVTVAPFEGNYIVVLQNQVLKILKFLRIANWRFEAVNQYINLSPSSTDYWQQFLNIYKPH